MIWLILCMVCAVLILFRETIVHSALSVIIKQKQHKIQELEKKTLDRTPKNSKDMTRYVVTSRESKDLVTFGTDQPAFTDKPAFTDGGDFTD